MPPRRWSWRPAPQISVRVLLWRAARLHQVPPLPRWRPCGARRRCTEGHDADTANVPASDVLGKICSDTRAAVAEAKTKISLEALRLQITVRGDAPRGFGSALKQAVAEGRYGLIAEIKKHRHPAG